MTLSPYHQKLILSRLLINDDEPPYLLYRGRLILLHRCYLCHLATGGRCLDVEDLLLAELLLAVWVEQEKEALR